MNAPPVIRTKMLRGQAVAFCLVFVVFMVGGILWFFESRRTKVDSAHSARTAEIVSNLTFISYSRRPFPDSLSELPLRYLDGGDSSLLPYFSYSSSGTSCTVRTRRPFGNEKQDRVWTF